MDVYLHLVRAPDDPEPTSRENRQRDYVAQWRKDLKREPLNLWRIRVRKMFEKLGACTFHRLCIEALDRDSAGCHDTPIEAALWDLVTNEHVEHTMHVPILFRLRESATSETAPHPTEESCPPEPRDS